MSFKECVRRGGGAGCFRGRQWAGHSNIMVGRGSAGPWGMGGLGAGKEFNVFRVFIIGSAEMKSMGIIVGTSIAAFQTTGQ